MPIPKRAAQLRTSKVGAGALGAGGGTLLVVLANSLPENLWWKRWAVLIAPSFAVGLSALAVWSRQVIEEYFSNWKKELLFSRAKGTIENLLNNPLTSAAHKNELREQLEQLELYRTKSDVELVVKEIK